MASSIETELRALLGVIFDLRVPEEKDAHLQISRPKNLNLLELGWLEDMVESIVEELLVTFDVRRKTKDDDPEEIADWKKPVQAGGWVERRKNHRLRIRTMVDDLFEKNVGSSDVPATLRAWKIQAVDQCANAILDRFHVRPAASGPWATYRRMMHDIGEELQRALGHKDLFLMTGRIAEARTMETKIENAHLAMRDLMRELEGSGLLGQTE